MKPTDARATILVIDDEPDNFDVVEALLQRENYQLTYISSGRRALDCLDDINPDVILLDVMMPDMTGIEFCRQMKAMLQWQAIPIIMITALATKEDLAQCLAAGADDFISKPVNGLELRARIHSMVRIKQQYDRLQEMLRLRTDLSNMVVHDLRNPLTSIVLAAEMLRCGDLPTDRQQIKVGQIIYASQQLQTMIDNLLLLAKLESGQMVLDRTEVDLKTLCSDALKDMEAIASQRKLTLESSLPTPSGMIHVDAAVFRRVLDNLLSNAIKFSPMGSRVVLEAECPSPNRAMVRVMDEGRGVSEELRQRIFDKYEIGYLMQGVAQTGLGLAFCKIAVEVHGGQIRVENNHPKGAIFTVEL